MNFGRLEKWKCCCICNAMNGPHVILPALHWSADHQTLRLSGGNTEYCFLICIVCIRNNTFFGYFLKYFWKSMKGILSVCCIMLCSSAFLQPLWAVSPKKAGPEQHLLRVTYLLVTSTSCNPSLEISKYPFTFFFKKGGHTLNSPDSQRNQTIRCE